MFIMRLSQHRAKLIFQPLIRILCGVLITMGVFHLSWGHDFGEWLFPMLFLTGLLVAWVTGPPWGCLVVAGYIWIQGAVTIVYAIRGPLVWFYGGNVIATVLGQSETLVLTLGLSLVASAGGLSGWGIASLVTRIYQHRHRIQGTRSMR